MSSNESNWTFASTVLVIILVLSLLCEPVTGKPIVGFPEEESPYFQSTDPDRTYLMKWYNVKGYFIAKHLFM